MTEPSRHPDSSPDTTRRWVRVLVVVVIITILLVAAILLSGGAGGGHGPSRHF